MLQNYCTLWRYTASVVPTTHTHYTESVCYQQTPLQQDAIYPSYPNSSHIAHLRLLPALAMLLVLLAVLVLVVMFLSLLAISTVIQLPWRWGALSSQLRRREGMSSLLALFLWQ